MRGIPEYPSSKSEPDRSSDAGDGERDGDMPSVVAVAAGRPGNTNTQKPRS